MCALGLGCIAARRGNKAPASLPPFCRSGSLRRWSRATSCERGWLHGADTRPARGLPRAAISHSSAASLTRLSLFPHPPSGFSHPACPLLLSRSIYYNFTLKFIVSLCYGRNSLVRDQLRWASREYGLGLEQEALAAAIKNPKLP